MRPIVDFTWDNQNEELVFTIGGDQYPYETQADAIVRASDVRYEAYTTPTNTPITFTAQVVVPAGLTIMEYRWEFGDGTIGFGPVVTHEYTAASPQTTTNLIITDDLGQRTSRHQVMNLRYGAFVMVHPVIRVTS